MNFAASLLLSLSLMAAGCGQSKEAASRKSAPAAAPVATQKESAAQTSFDLASIPDFSGKPYVVINDNVPSFSDKDKASTSSFEHYSKLDSLGRCGAAFANVSRSTMPTKKRGAIGNIKPSGWHTVKYEGIDGKYLYNRCHLIGFFDIVGYHVFKGQHPCYVKISCPIFKERELVARGVQMEAYSVEDKGAGVQFNVYVYNNQPGISINYETGRSKKA